MFDNIAMILAADLSLGTRIWDLILSIGIFVSVFLVVVAVFNQPGSVKMSPQREAAIATGHTDRATAFEKPALRPVLWLLLATAHRMNMPRLKGWLRRTLVYSGNPNYYTPEEYLALSMFIGLAIAAFLEIFHIFATGQFSVVTLLAGFVIGTGLIVIKLHAKATERVRTISKRVPYSLDLISLAMGAGATFTEAVRTVVREGSDDPFNGELTALLAEMELGTTRRRALQNLAERIPLDMLRSIVASVIQAEELGTPLSEALRSQATLLRMQRSVRAENAAAVASVRILVPSLLILGGVIIAVFSPMILRVLRKGMV